MKLGKEFKDFVTEQHRCRLNQVLCHGSTFSFKPVVLSFDLSAFSFSFLNLYVRFPSNIVLSWKINLSSEFQEDWTMGDGSNFGHVMRLDKLNYKLNAKNLKGH